MTLSRRDLMIGASALAATPRVAAAQPTNAASAGQALTSLFADLVQERLRNGPESATIYGLDVGANADLRGRLSD